MHIKKYINEAELDPSLRVSAEAFEDDGSRGWTLDEIDSYRDVLDTDLAEEEALDTKLQAIRHIMVSNSIDLILF